MEKSNKRSRKTTSGKPSSVEVTNVNEDGAKNLKIKDQKITRLQWKEFDETNNNWRVWNIPNLNREGQLYIKKLSKEPEAFIEEEWPEAENTYKMRSPTRLGE